MSTRTSYDPGTPCWVDLVSPDVDGAIEFYSGLFGWTSRDEFDDEGTRIYTNFLRDGQVVAGVGAQPSEMAGMPPVWQTYVAVEDVDATVARVADAGGSVMLPAMQVMDQGKMAIIADPSGAAIGLWEAGSHFGAEVCNEANTWSWNELMTRDVDGVLDFYTKVFDWTYDEVPMPFGAYHVVAGGDEGGRGGLMAMPDEVPDQVPNYWAVYFTVDDARATAAKAAELGGIIGVEPMDIPNVGVNAVLHDPNGGAFSVLQPPSREDG